MTKKMTSGTEIPDTHDIQTDEAKEIPLIVLVISTIGIPGLVPITPIELLTVLVYAFAVCLLVNDTIKTMIIKRYKMV